MSEYTVRTTRRTFSFDAGDDRAACEEAISRLAEPRHEREEPERLMRISRLHESERYWVVLDVNTILVQPNA